MNQALTAALALTVGAVSFCGSAFAEQTAGEKAAQSGRSAKTEIKKGVRGVEDSACETINGKLQCAGKKAKHKVQNASDSIGAKAKATKENAD